VAEEVQLTEALLALGSALNAPFHLEQVVQRVIDAATTFTGAQFGAFFYNVEDERGEAYTLYSISGVDQARFADFPLPRNTAVFAPTFNGEGVVRLDDVTADERYGHEEPWRGMPPGHLPVRSYLAVPVFSRDGSVLGGLFFGHAEVAVFREPHERFVRGAAMLAATAIDNARLHEQEHRIAETLQRRLLPQRVPDIPGVAVATRYEPAEDRAEVGGDWYDVLDLGGGRFAVVIGDVMGHNLGAAAVMGQVRNAVLAYAIEGHSPAGVLGRTTTFLASVASDAFASCCYVEVDPAGGTATAAVAGHPPPIVSVGTEAVVFPIFDVGPPLGVDPGTSYTESTVVVGGAAKLVLFTDGLVEGPDTPIDTGIEALRQLVADGPSAPNALADRILAEAPVGRDRDDDAALLVVALVGASERSTVFRRFPAEVASARGARQFASDVLREWSLEELLDPLQLLVSELVTNAVLYVAGHLEVHLTPLDDRLRVAVVDGSGEREPRLRPPDEADVSGRGIFLVDAVADAWGVNPHGVGKAVWFELRYDREGVGSAT
jgi:anti-sigma regulatory factor (Ser/Thr protein kinase)